MCIWNVHNATSHKLLSHCVRQHIQKFDTALILNWFSRITLNDYKYFIWCKNSTYLIHYDSNIQFYQYSNLKSFDVSQIKIERTVSTKRQLKYQLFRKMFIFSLSPITFYSCYRIQVKCLKDLIHLEQSKKIAMQNTFAMQLLCISCRVDNYAI